MITLGIDRTKRPRAKRRKSQFEVVLGICEDVVEFMAKNEAHNCKAYFSLGPGTVGLYLVTTSDAYDFALGDKLADFAVRYIDRGLLTSVTLLPASTPEQLTAYFDPRKTIRLAKMEQPENA